MSGIVGIVNLNGAPVDAELLRQMTEHMTFRGPDAQEVWIDSHVGLGHAMLRTTFEMAKEHQPLSLGGVWITADARIDARDELIRKLESKACCGVTHANDADLILHAYRVWGTNCVDHLLGDFAFAIWDASRQRLFCARDHFGIRQFHYAQVGECLIFSNNLDTIRQHPRVSDNLNDLAIVNFLLFHYQPRVDQTFFLDIQSLLPGQTLMWEGGTTKISRYWTLPIEDPIRYKRHHDYVDHFRELLDTAIEDRMRTDRAGILMSGGMDSSSIAATIHSLRVKKKKEFRLEATTFFYDRLMPDEEGKYAKQVAEFLGVPIHLVAMDDMKWFEGWDRMRFRFPEPRVNTSMWNDDHPVRRETIDAGVRVFYSGWGPDAMLSYEPTHYGTLLRNWCIADLVGQIGGFIVRYRSLPPLRVRTALKQWVRKLRGIAPTDIWGPDPEALGLLAQSVSETVDIPKLWWQFADRPQTHPWRPDTYSQLTNHYWTLGFQQFDAANWHAPIEFRYPYFDTRLVRYLLRMPVLPWCANKTLLREAMQGKLPETVRTRKKTPLARIPCHPYADWINENTLGKELARYVDMSRAPQHLNGDSGGRLGGRLIILNHWLRHYKLQTEPPGLST